MRALLTNLAVMEHDDLRAQAHERAEHMLHHDNGQLITLVELPQQFNSGFYFRRCQACKHLVKQ